jgi:hypothetical protein
MLFSEEFDSNLYTPVWLYDLELDLKRNNKNIYLLELLEPLKLQKKSSKSYEDLEFLESKEILNRLVNITIHNEIIN